MPPSGRQTLGFIEMVLSDEAIRRRVKGELCWDTSIDASRVLVTVQQGRVTLSGTMPSYTARMRAESDAYRIPDVTRVDNRILVQHPPGGEIPNDRDIRISIEGILLGDPDMEKTAIYVSVRNGSVTLEGSVDECWKRREAERIVSRVRGVRSIANTLAVVPTMTVADRAIADDVRTAIERNRNVNIEDVNIQVEYNVVTLSGAVPDRAAWHAAITAAEFTRGVRGVVDEMTIQPTNSLAGEAC